MKHVLSHRSIHATENARRARRRLVWATIVIVCLFGVDFVSDGILRRGVRTANDFSWQTLSVVGMRIKGTGFFTTRSRLAKENIALREQVARLQDTAAAYAALKADNDQLRSFLHVADTVRGITAPVTSSFTASPYGTFTIGAGSLDNVQKGTTVFTPDGFAIGRVEEVSARGALVVGIFSPGQRIDVRVGDTPLVLSGRGGGVAGADAPYRAKISVGDVAFAPSLGQVPVGIVGYVQEGDALASKNVLVRIPINLQSLSFVYVETAH